jgi:Tol biopolymer transport system component
MVEVYPDYEEWTGGFGDPALSADGKWLVFTGSAQGTLELEIYALELADSTVTRLTNNSVHDAHPTWSPDGKQIAFESRRSGNTEIHVMAIDGSGVRNLTQDPGWDSEPAWSPDGSRIAFTSSRTGNDDIYVVDVDGSNLRRLTPDPVEPPPTPTTDPYNIGPRQRPKWPDDTMPAWSPDGKRIAFASKRDGNWEIYVVNANEGAITRLTDHPETDYDPQWSPDGRHIVFWSRRSGSSGLYAMNVDGSGVRLLATLDSFFPDIDVPEPLIPWLIP